MKIKAILTIILVALLVGCSATRYVAQSSYLLHENKVNIHASQKRIAKQLSKSSLEDYVQQRPNRRFLGIGLYLGFYNVTDTSKHNWWHKFWGTKIGEAPVVLDSSMVEKSRREMEIYLNSRGFINSSVSDTITVNKRRKATVTYNVNLQKPYVIKSLTYNIEDTYIRQILKNDTLSPAIRIGEVFERQNFENERVRITELLRNQGFWGFNTSYISYTADTTQAENMVGVVLNLRRLRVGQDPKSGEITYRNHPIYRISNVAINTDYDPAMSIEQIKQADQDTTRYNGIDIYYKNKLYIRPEIISRALGLSSGVIYDQTSIQQAYNSIRSLGYSTNILFSTIDTARPEVVYSPDSLATTSEQALYCLVQCTPSSRQSIQTELEASTTSDYYSMALTLNYQNRNLFGGAENFNIAFRGAYEFNKIKGTNNSFEFGVTTSLALPRFLLPISPDKMRGFKYSSTKLTMSYNIQNRPFYRRSLISAVYGYSWTTKNGARFTINPADVNVVNVPWKDSTFVTDIKNPYLAQSYSSQLIAGASASYIYSTNTDIKQNSTTFRLMGDVNGNLFSLVSAIIDRPHHENGEKTNHFFGLKYAQYVRLSGDISRRINVGQRSQIAWRVLAAAGYAYGNSKILPSERMFFAGGSNSMRGWQVRTLGQGGVQLGNLGAYPNQLGDIHLEANFEYRINIVGGFNMAAFLDCGNIWFNGKGENNEQARFNFNTFYKQLALNTGIGIRYDFSYIVIRLDWGIKLHNPNVSASKRWFGQMEIDKTALHFAIGLPF